jgi:hypothetical protein
VVERYGRHVGTRTPDLYRVKTWFWLGRSVQKGALVAVSRVPYRYAAIPARACSQPQITAIWLKFVGKFVGRNVSVPNQPGGLHFPAILASRQAGWGTPLKSEGCWVYFIGQRPGVRNIVT